jgi:lipoprotein-releasing system ATP-binding protein
MLEAKGVKKMYGSLEVLKGIDLTINKGEVVSIVGASGAGKSTLLHILGTLDSADHGKVFLNNQELSSLKGNELARFRNKNMGFIFQFHNLLPEFSALENICIPAFIANEPAKKVEQRAMELMSLLGVAQRKDHKPSQMSGGEQQRTAVARALINSPSIVFADEPSGNLDSKHAEELHNLFFTLRDKMGQTFVIVTHNELLAEMADRKIEMKDGKVLI